MAFAQLAKATGNDEYALIARRIFGRILERRSNPKVNGARHILEHVR